MSPWLNDGNRKGLNLCLRTEAGKRLMLDVICEYLLDYDPDSPWQSRWETMLQTAKGEGVIDDETYINFGGGQ